MAAVSGRRHDGEVLEVQLPSGAVQFASACSCGELRNAELYGRPEHAQEALDQHLGVTLSGDGQGD